MDKPIGKEYRKRVAPCNRSNMTPLVMLEKLMTSIEKRVLGPGAFLTYQRATRALLKFCEEHNCDDPAMVHIRACLSALEASERRNAIEAYQNIRWDKEGFGDWWPPVVFPSENEEYVTDVFNALTERWHRLMEGLTQAPA